MRIAALLIVAALAGCVADEPEPTTEPTTEAETASYAQVVVAVMDSGTNPYHEHFAGDIPAEVLSTLTYQGAAPESVQLSTNGSYDERFQADAELLAGLQSDTLYHFEGTRILGISFGSEIPVLDDNGSSHGTATSGAVLDANPNAIVVMVDGDRTAAEEWVAAQPWIDITSMSYGPLGSIPLTGELVFGLTTHAQTRTMWANGQLPVGAADNSPALAPTDETAGPPWVIGVAGDHPEEPCREPISGTFPDFTADFTQTLPDAYDTESRSQTSGTSFSTPTTAGTLSAVVQQVRAAWNHTGGIVDGTLAISPDGERLTNQDFRDALQRTAYYFDFTPCLSGSAPVNPAAPWLQMGWGHVGPEIVNATVAHLLGEQEAPQADPAAAAFQGAVMQSRELLWETLLP